MMTSVRSTDAEGAAAFLETQFPLEEKAVDPLQPGSVDGETIDRVVEPFVSMSLVDAREKRNYEINVISRAHVKGCVKSGLSQSEFSRRVVELGDRLLYFSFGFGINDHAVEEFNILHALWIQSCSIGGGDSKGTDTAVGFAFICEVIEPRSDSSGKVINSSHYKLMGLCVDAQYRRLGCATALVAKCESLLPPGSVLKLCVDNYRPETVRLCEWYTKLGFRREDPDFPRKLRTSESDDEDDDAGELFDDYCLEIGFVKKMA